MNKVLRNMPLHCSRLLLLAAAPVVAAQPMLEEVIVTAQKKAESLQDAPISISAFGAEAMEAKGIHNLVDLRANVPNLQLTPHPNSATSARIFMRGVGNNDDQITQDPSIAVYMDGVYVARSQGLAQEVADIAQIEVLRGPQGTLYGRNATGGAINVVTRGPDLGEFGFSQALSAGNYDYFRSRTSVNVPLGESFAAKFAYLQSEKEGFVDNLGTGVERFGDQERAAWRADLLWEPTDSLRLRYGYDRSQIDDTPMFLTLAPLYPQQAERPSRGSEFVDNLQANDVTAQGHSLTVSWLLNDALELKYIGAFRELDNFTYQDYHSGVPGDHALIVTVFDGPQEQTSHELQLLGEAFDSRLEFIVGAYVFEEWAESVDLTVLENLPIDLTGDGSPDARSDVYIFRDVEIDNSAQALFGQATYTPQWLDSRLHITAGLRVSQDQRKAIKNTTTELRDIAPLVPLPFPSPAMLTMVDPEGKGDRDFDDVSPSLVVAYDLSDAINVYAKLVKGYKTGGYNVRASSVERFNAGFDEETLISTELGLKSELWNNRLRLNAAVFQADYDDIQINLQTDPNDVTVTDVLNVGQAVIEGAELDITAVLSESLTLNVNYGYLDPDYREILGENGEELRDMFRFVNAPQHSAGIDLSYVRPLSFAEFSANLGYTWQDEKFSKTTLDNGTYIVDDYGLLNARVGLSDIALLGGSLRTAIWGRNLEDKEYYIAHFDALVPTAVFGDPRSYGIDVMFEY